MAFKIPYTLNVSAVSHSELAFPLFSHSSMLISPPSTTVMTSKDGMTCVS